MVFHGLLTTAGLRVWYHFEEVPIGQPELCEDGCTIILFDPVEPIRDCEQKMVPCLQGLKGIVKKGIINKGLAAFLSETISSRPP